MLAFFGVIFLLFIGKFIWDTFITGETERQHQVHKRNNPEEVARMENTISRKEYLNFNYSPKSNPKHRQASLEMTAKKLGCTPSNAEQRWLEETTDLLAKSGLTERGAIELVEGTLAPARQKKSDEAVKRVIDPDDTTAGLIEQWTKDLIEAIKVRLFQEQKEADDCYGKVMVSNLYEATGGCIVQFSQSKKNSSKDIVRFVEEFWPDKKVIETQITVGDVLDSRCISEIYIITGSQTTFEL